MRSTIRIALSAALAVVAFALPEIAAAQTSGFELIPFVGYRTDGDVNVDDFGDPNLKIDSSELYGAAFDIPLWRGLKLELMANRQDSALTFDPGLFAGEVGLGDVEITYVHVGVLWQWELGQVKPYVVGSGGLTRLDPTAPGVGSEDKPSLSLGGGVKTFFTPNFGLRFEARGYATALDGSFDDDGGRCRRDCSYNDTLYQAEATAGLIFAW